MFFDDLDFFLLDAAWRCGTPVDIFFCHCPGIHLNIHCPPYSPEELLLALSELFARGDLIARGSKYEWSRGRQLEFTPTRDEVEAALHGAIPLYYELTAQGGTLWESITQPDWSRYVDWSSDCRFDEIACPSRDYLEYRLELERRSGAIGGPVEWRELEPWKLLAWKTMPHAWQVRYRTAPEPRGSSRTDDLFPPPWDRRRRHWPPGRVNLAERRVRADSRQPAEEERWPQRRLQKRMSRGWPIRQAFSAACAYVQRADTVTLLRDLADYNASAVSFAIVRELVQRRERRAVPILIRMLWRNQREVALWALGELCDEEALPVLSILLEYGLTPQCTHTSAAGALVRAMARFGDAALPIIEKELRSGVWNRHEIACAILTSMRSAASRALLEEESNRQQAAGKSPWYLDRALGTEIGPQTETERHSKVAWILTRDWNGPVPQNPIPALVEILENAKHWLCRRIAVDILAELDDPIAAPPIARLVTHPEWEVRASVACALYRWNAEPDALRTLAADENPAVRWLAQHRLD